MFPWIAGGIVNFDVQYKNKNKHIEIPGRFSPMYYCYAYSVDGDNYTLRPSCYNCKFRTMERVGDITIGDFWGMTKFNKELINADMRKYGLSLVLINSQVGYEIFCKVKDKINYFGTKKEHVATQPALQASHRNIPQKRALIYNNIGVLDYKSLVHEFIFPYNYKYKRAKNKFIVKYLVQYKSREFLYKLPYVSKFVRAFKAKIKL